jgi:hypothetical protein
LGFLPLFLFNFNLITLANDTNSKSVIYDDVYISTTAGLYQKTNGDYGFGWMTVFRNNVNQSFLITHDLYWYSLKGDLMLFANYSTILNPFGMHTSSMATIGRVPIHRITINAYANELFVSRSGFEIGPFVFFTD